MNQVLTLLKTFPIPDLTVLDLPIESVFVPQQVFVEYHLKAFNCTILGNYLEITRFVITDKGCGYGSRLLADLDEWAKSRGLRLCLTAMPYGDNSAKAIRRLELFYLRRGFIFANDDENCPEEMYKP